MKKWTNEEIQILKILYLKKILIRKISRILDRSEKSIIMKIRRMSLHKERKRLLIKTVKEFLEKKYSNSKIALILKMSRDTISNYRKKG